jgi:hypothetical protein
MLGALDDLTQVHAKLAQQQDIIAKKIEYASSILVNRIETRWLNNDPINFVPSIPMEQLSQLYKDLAKISPTVFFDLLNYAIIQSEKKSKKSKWLTKHCSLLVDSHPHPPGHCILARYLPLLPVTWQHVKPGGVGCYALKTSTNPANNPVLQMLLSTPWLIMVLSGMVTSFTKASAKMLTIRH